MDTTIIHKTARATLAGTNSFPDAVRDFLNAGVESYHVDYVTLRKTFYGVDGSVAVEPLVFEQLPPVAADFSVENLKAAILDSQRNGQTFRDFSSRAMQAGVQGYVAFLRGKRVTYWGRRGDQHTEWFPGAAPGSQV